jgi:hypothetical protein
MDPLGTSLAAVAAAALAMLGGRSRVDHANGIRPTIGEQAEAAGDSVAGKALGVAATVGRIGTEVTAGTLEAAGVAGAAVVRAVGRFTDSVSAPVLSLAAGTVARAGGLLLDGAAAVADGISPSLRRQSTTAN